MSDSDTDEKVERVCKALMAKHGQGVLRREAHGLHFYLPSPACLEQYGEEELNKRHMTINLDRYFRRGSWASRAYEDPDNSAYCHKTETRYNVSDLLNMAPLSARGIRAGVQAKVLRPAEDREHYLIKDEQGRLIPDHPGMVQPVSALLPGHQALDYLLDRGYDINRLETQFRISYCLQETTVTNGLRRGYRLLPGGFRDTPQGRLIFYADVKGAQVAWQARILERTIFPVKQYFHPYKMEWVTTHVFDGDDYVLVPELQEEIAQSGKSDFKFNPSKYYTAKAAMRSMLVMGYDAAIAWNLENGTSTCVLAEGPLDAGRCGPPGVAMIGKYLNDDQAKLLTDAFKRVIYVADKDKAGIAARQSVERALLGKTDLMVEDVQQFHTDESKKDLGDGDYELIWKRLKEIII